MSRNFLHFLVSKSKEKCVTKPSTFSSLKNHQTQFSAKETKNVPAKPAEMSLASSLGHLVIQLKIVTAFTVNESFCDLGTNIIGYPSTSCKNSKDFCSATQKRAREKRLCVVVFSTLFFVGNINT